MGAYPYSHVHSVRENSGILVRTVCSDPDYRPGHVETHDEPVDEKGITGPKLWHVHSSSELAELQRTDPDIGL